MKAEIISVGTELLLGKVINTDTAIVARALSTLGIDLLHTCVVGDNAARIEEDVTRALGRSDLLVVTGGLGPTGDDITKESVAKAAGRQLTLHEESLARLKEYFGSRPMDDNQLRQVMLPQGCYALQNDCGTAPGCIFTAENGSTVVMLPGPPSELEPMLTNYAVPRLLKSANAVIVTHDLHVYGQGEGHVAAVIDDLMYGANPTVATYAKQGEMFVRVAAKAENTEQADRLCLPMMQQVQARLGDDIYGVDVESLEQTVVELLIRQHKTIATAESCTGGLLAKRITDIAGASQVFHMGAVTYENWVKEQMLGVDKETLERFGAVSEQTAAQMARGIRLAAGADIGVSLTGIAGPGGGTAEKPVGLVYIGLSVRGEEKPWVYKKMPVGRTRDRDWNRYTAASRALDMVRRLLNDKPLW